MMMRFPEVILSLHIVKERAHWGRMFQEEQPRNYKDLGSVLVREVSIKL